MKRIFFALMSFLMAAGVMQAATGYGFKVGGVDVTSDNCSNVTGSNITSGTVVYNPTSNTVTLTNVTINRTGKDNRAIYNTGCTDLKIVLAGTCNLSASSSSVIRLERKSTITVPEGSTATITGGSEGGIYITNSSSVVINGSGTLNITADSKGGIEGSSSENTLSFSNIHATIKGGGGDLLDLYRVSFSGNCNVVLKATNSNSNPNMNNVSDCLMMDNQFIVRPFGASYDAEAKSVVYNGMNVYSRDVVISNDYVALITAKYFPDDNFRNVLSGLFPQGYITAADVEATTSLNLNNKGIAKLSGIEYFTALTSLDCSQNQLTALNVNALTKLRTLNCELNQISTLDLRQNTKLNSLTCYRNKISGTNANSFINNLPTRTTATTVLFKTRASEDGNQLTPAQVKLMDGKKWNPQYLKYGTRYQYYGEVPINATTFPDAKFRQWVSGSLDKDHDGVLNDTEPACTSVAARGQGIASLRGVEFLLYLQSLDCGNNNLTTIDLSQNLDLRQLVCDGNGFTTLNLSQNHQLASLDCSNNRLTSITLTGSYPSLRELNCYLNAFEGNAASALIDCLPALDEISRDFKFKWNDEPEANAFTREQVQAARAKNWYPQRYTGGEPLWVDYNGESEGLPGDLNDDGMVDVTDVSIAIDMVLGKATPDLARGDLNADGTIDVTDVSLIIDIVLGVE